MFAKKADIGLAGLSIRQIKSLGHAPRFTLHSTRKHHVGLKKVLVFYDQFSDRSLDKHS